MNETERPRLAEMAIFGIWLFVIGVGVLVHEPWFDEAQAWLLARDASLLDLLTKYLRYEGHPPLWYFILHVPAALGMPYKTINVVSALIAAGGVLLLLLNREIPLVIRGLLPFTYFVAYQYTIISRSYVLILPLLLAILAIYPRRRERLWLFVLLLALLCHVSLHATAMAGALTLVYGSELIRDGFPRGAELRKHIAAAAVLLLNVALIALMLRTPADIAIRPNLEPLTRYRIEAISWHGLTANLGGSGSVSELIVSLLAFILLVIWFLRRGTLVTFVLLIIFLVPIASVYFNYWHEGLFFIAITFSILLTFIRAKQTPRSSRDQRYDLVMTAVVALLLLRSISATWASYTFDINYPYSGSQAAAEFIKEHRIDRARLFGAGFPSLAIQPYFARNVFANYQSSGGFSFWDWSSRTPWFYRPATILKRDELKAWQAKQIAQRPDYFLVSVKFPSDGLYAEALQAAGYVEIASFPGALFWKHRPVEAEGYRLFARPDLVKTPPPSPAPAVAPSRTGTQPR